MMSISSLIVVIAHTPLASALLATAEHVFGPQEGVYVYDIKPDVEPETKVQEILSRLEELNPEQTKQVLILSDLVGATPNNIGVQVVENLQEEGVLAHILSGASVSMLINVIAYRDRPLFELCEQAIEGAFKGIRCTDKK